MEEYIIDGTIYSKNQLKSFASSKNTTLNDLLNSNPDIQVKSFPTNQGAFVETRIAPVTGYKSGNIFLDSQEDDEEPGLLTSLAARTARGFVSAFKGISSLVDGIRFGIYNIYNPDMTADEKIAVKADIERGFTDSLEGAEEWLSQFTQRTESESVLDAIKKGDFGDAAELIVGGALESLPSIVAAFTGYGGIALFGASVAGNKFDEEFDKNPDEALGRLAFNSIGSGAIEAGFELATRGLLKQAGLIGAKSGTQAAKKFLEKGASTIVKKVGYGFGHEAVSEASTEITQILFDALPREMGGLGRTTDMGEAITRVFDAGAIGGFVGGTISTAGQVKTNAAKERAEYALMVPSMKSELIQTGINMSKLAKQIPNADAKGKKLLHEEIENLEAKAQRIKNKNSIFLNRLSDNRPELEEYAANIELLNEQASIFRNEENPKDVKNLAMERGESLREQNEDIVKRVNERLVEESIEKTKVAAGKLDRVSLTAFETTKEKEEASKKRKKEKGSVISETADGVIFQNPDGSQEIFLDKETMLKNNVIDAAEHELFHAILHKTFKDKGGLSTEFGNYLAQEINKLDQKAISKVKGSEFAARLKKYKERIDVTTQEGKDILGDEILALFSDAVRRGDIKYEETVFTKIEDFIRRILQNIGFTNIKFDNSKDVYNFIRDYNADIGQGGIRGSMLKGAVKGFAGKIVRGEGKGIENKEIQKFSVSETGQRLSREVQEIYEEKGEAGAAEIISRFGPIIDRLVKSREGAAGFDYELLRTELEYGLGTVNKKGETKLRSILGLIRDYDPKKHVGVPLAAYINTRIYQRLIEASRKILKEKFDVDISEIQVGDLESALENNTTMDTNDIVQEDVDALIDPLKELVTEEDLIEQIQKEIINNFDIEDLPNLTYANLKDLAPKLTKKIFGETTDERLQFVLDNAETLHALLPLAAMQKAVGDKRLKTSTKIEGSVLNNFYIKGDRKDMPAGGTAAGLPIQAKIPFDESQWDDLFGSDPSIGRRNQKETLLPKLMNEIGRAITNSVVRHHLLKQGIEGAIVLDLADGKSRQLYSETNKEIQESIQSLTGATETYIDLYANLENVEKIKSAIKTFTEERKGKIQNEEDYKQFLKIMQRSFSERGYKPSERKQASNYFEGGYKPFYEFLGETDNYIRNSKILNYKDQKKKIYNKSTGTMDLNKLTQNDIKDRDFLWNEFNEAIKWGMKNLSPNMESLWLTGLMNNTNSLGRSSAYIGVTTDFKGKGPEVFHGEHNDPVLDAIANIRNIYKNHGFDSAKTKKLIEEYKKKYYVAIIPKETADKLPTTNRFYNEDEDNINNIIKHLPDGVKVVDNRPIEKGQKESRSELEARLNRDFPKATKAEIDAQLDLLDRSPATRFKEMTIKEAEESGREFRVNDRGDVVFIEGGPLTGKTKKARLKEAKKISTQRGSIIQKLSLSGDMNRILEETKGMAKTKVIGDVDALLRARKADKMRFFVPFSAEDFEGLIYYFLGKGKEGDEHYKFFKDNLFRPLSEGLMLFDAAKLKADNKLKAIKKAIKKAGIDLTAQVKSSKEPELEKFTNEQVIRMFMWLTSGREGNLGLDLKDDAAIRRYVRQELNFANLAQDLKNIYPDGMYPDPTDSWYAETLLTDLLNVFNDKTRKEYLKSFFNNVDKILGKFSGGKLSGPNANKIKALYGNNFIAALENILTRIESGKNRKIGPDRVTNSFMNWTNDAVGTIMFFNTRSAVLQMISFANFINWSDNNFASATARFMDQKQYWKDFVYLFNSDFLKSRRKGLRIDVNADEIADAAATSQNKLKAGISAILKLGFLPTQIADSTAISIGGAAFYRNRINKYIKDGLKQKEAEKQAFLDFQELTTEAQQSSRPDRISMQQASPLGRVILAFQNTPMQYTRLIKKSVLDLVNNRGDWKTNLSKITYYAAIQNIIFHGLQSAMFAMAFSGEDDDERQKRYKNLSNRIADSLLIGTGVYGAIAATTKNVILEVIDQEKSGRRDFEKAALKSTAISPPINSKLQKLLRSSRRFQYKQEREKIREMGLTSRNPAVISAGEILSAVFNLPADRAIRKWNNLVRAADSETELWQSIALTLGYSEWDVKLMDNEDRVGLKTNGLKSLKKKKFKKLNE